MGAQLTKGLVLALALLAGCEEPRDAVVDAGVTDPRQTEQFTQLTDDARLDGMAVAYVDHRSPRDMASIRDMGLVPGLIAER